MAKKTTSKNGTNWKEQAESAGGIERGQTTSERPQVGVQRVQATSQHVQGFKFRAPDAGSVQLVGDFTHWQEKPITLKKEAGGVWHASVLLSPGEHHYRFLVDGQWRDDPECAVRVPNPFGGQNMMRKVA
ncbi:MAG: isoamylase early set domain-containing protein [Limisphaerales bacterium]